MSAPVDVCLPGFGEVGRNFATDLGDRRSPLA
jgi:hypothetical protein